VIAARSATLADDLVSWVTEPLDPIHFTSPSPSAPERVRAA